MFPDFISLDKTFGLSISLLFSFFSLYFFSNFLSALFVSIRDFLFFFFIFLFRSRCFSSYLRNYLGFFRVYLKLSVSVLNVFVLFFLLFNLYRLSLNIRPRIFRFCFLYMFWFALYHYCYSVIILHLFDSCLIATFNFLLSRLPLSFVLAQCLEEYFSSIPFYLSPSSRSFF